LGYLPINGPGNYFISLMVQMIIIFPLIYTFYKRDPTRCTICCFIFAILWEGINNFGFGGGFWYMDSIIRFLPHIVLGIWIAKLYRDSALLNKYIIFFGLLSCIYLIFISQFEKGVVFGVHFVPYTASQNIFGSCWVALILIIGLLFLPKKANLVTSPFAFIGKASYHIYLVQIVYFGVFSGFGLKYHSISDLFSAQNLFIIAITLVIILILGLCFYLTDKNNFFIQKKLP
jgi:peptidoglycan/LPS O-acetylase OafA/YrhL